jgi:hypothetical protein
MKKPRPVVTLAGVIVVLVICAALWSTNNPSNLSAHPDVLPSTRPKHGAGDKPLPPLPPKGESLGSTYNLLVTRTAEGSGNAAKRLFNDVSECLRADRLDSAFSKAVNDKNWILNNPESFTGSGGDPDVNRKRALDQIESELDDIKHARRLCAGAPSDLNDGRIYRIALDAAQSGDTRATACLLIAPYKSPPVSTRDGEIYASEVLALANNAIKNGSWDVAIAMMYVYNGMPHSGYSQYVTFVDPKKELEYSDLVRMGVPDGSPDAVHLDRRLKILSQSLSSEEASAAMAWAKRMYQNYFFTSGPAFSDSPPCRF